MMTLELADGRGELFQWDTGRIIEFGEDAVSQAHFTSTEKVTDIPYTVEVKNGKAAIPDELLQVPGTLIVYAWVSDTNGGYTKAQVNLPVFARPKPSDYVYTPTDQMTLQTIQRQIGDLADLTTEAKDTLVAAINEVARTGGAGSMDLRVADGYIQYSTDGGSTWTNLIAVAELKGGKGDPGNKGDTGATGAPGKDGKDGTNGITPHIGDNGHWYLGTTDTGKPSRGVTGAKGDAGATGPVGPVGPQGPAGVPGKDGAPGAQGEKGDKGDPGKKGDPGAPGKNGSDATVTAASITGALGYKPAAPGDIPVVPTAEISANTAARHTHANKGVLDGITGQVTADKVNAPDHATDLVQYGAFKIAANQLAQQIIKQIPTALPSPNALTVTSGSNSVTYDGSTAESIDIPSVEKIVTETTQVLPAYTNLIPISTDASGAVLNGVGYEAGALKSNGSVVSGSAFTSGFIPVKKGDVVRIKDPGVASFSLENAVALYKADKAISDNICKYVHSMQTGAAYGGITISGNVLTWDTSSISYYFWQGFKYLRVMTSSADSIVTINEEIKESTQTVMSLKPTVKVGKGSLDFAVNEPLLAGRKIVVFGDSLIGMTRDQTSVPAYAAAYTGAKVYNVGFGGCRMAKHPSNGYAAFSMWALADAVAAGNYATQEAQAPSGSDYFASQLDVLKSIDFTSVDAIVIHYGTNDFAANVPLDDAANLISTDTVCGALRYSIKKLLTAFPKIKIFISLPLYRTWNGVGAETYKNGLEKTLPEYDSAMKMVAEEYNLPTIDGYKRLGINAINAGAYLSDGTHLNDFGRRQFGELIGGCLICNT